MKNIVEYVNEGRQIEYTVCIADVLDSEDIPVTVSILVDKAYQKSFEKWLDKQDGNEFLHVSGGNIEY